MWLFTFIVLSKDSEGIFEVFLRIHFRELLLDEAEEAGEVQLASVSVIHLVEGDGGDEDGEEDDGDEEDKNNNGQDCENEDITGDNESDRDF